jgi:hypothetical protein
LGRPTGQLIDEIETRINIVDVKEDIVAPAPQGDRNFVLPTGGTLPRDDK